jgi:cell surface protein SprA
MSRDYFAYGEKLENGLPLPGWSIRWSGLEKLPIIKKFLRSLSLEHGFSGKEVRAWQFENFSGPNMPLLDLETFISDFQEFERSSRVNTNFSPLIGLTASLQKGISMNFRHNLSKSLDRVPTGITVHRDKSYTSSANYSHRGGITIPLPFMEDYKIQNTVNFQFNFDMNESETLGSKNGGLEFGQTAFNSGWKTGIRITYTFSAKVSGSMIYGYHENESMTTGKKIDRDFGFDVNIAITG